MKTPSKKSIIILTRPLPNATHSSSLPGYTTPPKSVEALVEMTPMLCSWSARFKRSRLTELLTAKKSCPVERTVIHPTSGLNR